MTTPTPSDQYQRELLAIDVLTPSLENGRYIIKNHGINFASGFSPEECKQNAKNHITASYNAAIDTVPRPKTTVVSAEDFAYLNHCDRCCFDEDEIPPLAKSDWIHFSDAQKEIARIKQRDEAIRQEARDEAL